MKFALPTPGKFNKNIRQQVKFWREVALPGLSVVGLVMLIRLMGLLQSQEWLAFDQLLRLRPTEAVDSRIVIVGINEDDINYVQDFPIPDRQLAQLINILQSYQPRVIGFDIFKTPNRNLERTQLGSVFRESSNLIAVEVALNQSETFNVKPPPELPPERVGFADLIVDADGKLRRSILASKTHSGELKYSLPLRLAQAYLHEEGIVFQHGTRSYDPIQFGSIKLPRFLQNWGGYVRADANGNQVLLNFRSHRQPFRTLSLREVLTREFDPNWIRDRVVLIGMTASSVKDNFITSAVKGTLYTDALGIQNSSNQYQWIYGVEIHAHATSQILSKVLNKRPLLRVWSDIWEYLWILSWGLLGIILGLILQSPWKTFLSLGIASFVLVGICYGFLVLGWWIPLVPSLFTLAGAGLMVSFFDRDLRTLLEQRSLTLQRSFEAIHNGPLQTLAVMLRSLGEEEVSTEEMRSQLQELNQELRSIPDSLSQEMLSRDETLCLEGNVVLDLQTPIAELLYQVYDITLRRSFQGFTTILSFIPPNFEPLEESHFNTAKKRCLCLFLQEALCNVGKHAKGATRLDVICTRDSLWYCLKIIDNGAGIVSNSNHTEGRGGTKQAHEIARQLRGKFQRFSHSPQGTICELTWPVPMAWWQ
jgi:CHASE2 domain-containing sensor protein/two-component sensor histidine kinase